MEAVGGLFFGSVPYERSVPIREAVANIHQGLEMFGPLSRDRIRFIGGWRKHVSCGCARAFGRFSPCLHALTVSRAGASAKGLIPTFAANEAGSLASIQYRGCESGRGLPRCKICRRSRSVLECGSPLPLSNINRVRYFPGFVSWKVNEAELRQYRRPVGFGPSSKT